MSQHDNQRRQPAFETRLVHTGRHPQQHGGTVNTPVYRASTIVHASLHELEQARQNRATKDALVYGRLGTPTTFALENALAELEGGYGGVAVSTGLAAITTALLAFVETGDHLLMVDTVYGPTRRFCDQALSRLGVEVTYYDPLATTDELAALLRPNSRCIYLESPGSQTFEVQDVSSITALAKAHNLITLLDNSWATPYFFRPLEHGVNVSICAATKYITGHSDAMLGMVISDQAHYPAVRNARDLYGHSAAPDDVYLGLRGLRTLGVRMPQHYRQGLAVAHWLQQHPRVKRVLHPALPDCPGHAFWQRDFSGAAGLFSFALQPRDRQALAALLDHMALFSMGFSWGGFESLILPLEPGHRTATEWPSGHQLFRLHIGLEHTDDLIADLAAGIERYHAA